MIGRYRGGIVQYPWRKASGNCISPIIKANLS
jgi:hypothetical protein